MSGNTKDSLQQTITSSGQKKKVRRRSETPPETAYVSSFQAQVGRQFGKMVIVSPERRCMGPGGVNPYVQVQCQECGMRAWRNYGNMTKERLVRCFSGCPMQPPGWLVSRMAAARKRCTDTSDKRWVSYGGRGIEFRFDSPVSGARWVMDNLGVERWMSLDRIDNDGHYEPGNLRWATMGQQLRNRQNTVIPEGWVFRQSEWPYTHLTVKTYLRRGWTRDAILQQARQTVAEKGAHWRRIEERLASMTC